MHTVICFTTVSLETPEIFSFCVEYLCGAKLNYMLVRKVLEMGHVPPPPACPHISNIPTGVAFQLSYYAIWLFTYKMKIMERSGEFRNYHTSYVSYSPHLAP